MERFPEKKLNISDIIRFRLRLISAKDVVILVVAALVTAAISLVMPYFTKLLTGDVMDSGNVRMLLGLTVFIVATELFSRLIIFIRTVVSGGLKISLRKKTEAAVMDRLLSLPLSFFRRYTAGELYSRMAAVGDLGDIFSESMVIGLISALSSLMSLTQVQNFAPMLTLPAILIIILSLSVSVGSALLKKALEIMNQALEE